MARVSCTPRHRRLEEQGPTFGGYLPAKFDSRVSIDMTCSLLRFGCILNEVQRSARTQHLQYAPQVKYGYGALKTLSKCTNVPSLGPLAQNVEIPQDPLRKNPVSGTCPCTPRLRQPQNHASVHSENRPAEFRCWRASIGFTCNFFPLIFARVHAAGRFMSWVVLIDHYAIGTVILPSFRRVERCLPRPGRPSRSRSTADSAWTQI